MVAQKVHSDAPSTWKKPVGLAIYLALGCTILCLSDNTKLQAAQRSDTDNPERKHVLVLMPENLGFEGKMKFVQGLSEVLEVPEAVELYTEAVDLNLLKEPANAAEVANIYRAKYKDVRLDLVIAGQRPLLEFLLANRQTLFPGVPIVFGMIPKDIPVPTVRYPGVTGSTAVLDYGKTVELALALQPQTERVILVSGSSARDKWLQWIAKEQFRPLEKRVQFAFWEGFTPSELKDRFQQLRKADVLFYLTESKDKEGHAYSLEQYLDRIAPSSPVPIYGSLTQLLGHGIVGGNLYDNSEEARVIAEQAKQVLAGKRPEDIPIADVKMNPTVDARELERWRIPISRVPAWTEVRLLEPTLWEKHRVAIVGIAVFIAFETGLLFLLWRQVQKTNAARRMVELRYATERVVTEYSEKFTHCAPEDVEGRIQEGLAAIRHTKEVEWAQWLTIEPGTGQIGKSFTSTGEAIPEESSLRLGPNTPWLMEQIEAGQIVVISSLNQIPEQATVDRSYLGSLGVESLLVIPSSSDHGTKSALVLACLERGREWPRAVIARLSTMGNLFGTAHRRRRAEVELREKKEWLEMALEASKTALWDLDLLTGKVRWSQRDDSLLGKAPLELEVSWEKFLERVPEEDRDDLYRRTLARLEDQSGNDIFLTEWRYHEPGGSERWVLFRGRVYRDSHGRPLRLRGVNVDITELKEARSELVELTERLIQAQESERQRLARELHDDIGQRLSLLIIGLDRLRHGLPLGTRTLREELGASLQEAGQLATDIHGLSHQLHSTKLKHLGLKAALRELCTQVARQHGVEVNLQAGVIPGEVSEERALCLYRVAQEALNNAVKHSGSPTIDVELAAIPNMLQLKVRDHGAGFDVNHHAAGVGLASMRERIRMAAGKLHISSKPGQGTEIVTEVALEVEKQLSAN